MQIHLNLAVLMAKNKMTNIELAEKTGLSVHQVSLLRHNHAKSIRFSLLSNLCKHLNCEAGDVIELQDSISDNQ